MNKNRLAAEKSPYLLQHCENPVDWHPWGEEAFTRAVEEKKPIFLSIGYSTCHWCHVMERECFEDAEVAKVLNDSFISIKVDREERPDIDSVYMDVCQALTGGGGWPLNLLLTPDKLPFFAGTYIPKESRWGRPGLIPLLRNARAMWENDPTHLSGAGKKLIEALTLSKENSSGKLPSHEIFTEAVETFRKVFDRANGGFGSSPKFPSPHQLLFLLRRARRDGDKEALAMATATLDGIEKGGIHDHVGGGFHRYATDANWKTPHFEKMLYDQAGLALAFLEGYRATGKKIYERALRRTLDYLSGDLSGPGGGFYCAEDADSEGEEGTFYTWVKSEIEEILSEEEANLFSTLFGLTGDGNYLDEATKKATGRNIIHLEHPVGWWARKLNISPEKLSELIDEGLGRLFKRRAERMRPHLDDKIITAWSAMALTAFARAAMALGDEKVLARAEAAGDFLITRMKEGKTLMRRYRDGETAVVGFAEDYAFYGFSMAELFLATSKTKYLEEALFGAKALVEEFKEEGTGIIYDTPKSGEELSIRPHTPHDGPYSSAQSVAAELFGRLWIITGEERFRGLAVSTIEAIAEHLKKAPVAYTSFLNALSIIIEPVRRVTITGPEKERDEIFDKVKTIYSPESIVMRKPKGIDDGELSKMAPALALEDGQKGGAHICSGESCALPLYDIGELTEMLAKPL